MASRLRIGAALLGAAALLSLSTPAAFADVIVEPIPGSDNRKWGHDISLLKDVGNHPTPKRDEYSTSLIPLKVKENGQTSKVWAYCVELPTYLQDHKGLKESEWGKHPNPASKFNEPERAGKILWILTNSYPVLSMDAFQKQWGDNYDEREVIGATQAAIWHFSDNAEIDEKRENKDNADVVTLYKKFISQAKVVEKQPNPTLQITPSEAKGEAGKKIGPFQVSTTASEVQLTAKLPNGVTITDAQGNPLNITKSGDELKAKAEGTKDKVSEFFVNVPADAPAGKVELKAKAEAELQAGRLFVGENYKDHPTQSLVIANNSKVTVEKPAKAEWTAAPVVTQPPSSSTTPPTTTTTTTEPSTTTTTPAAPAPGGSTDEDLASTGASIMWPLIGGLVLIGGGVAALFVVRRKKAGA